MLFDDSFRNRDICVCNVSALGWSERLQCSCPPEVLTHFIFINSETVSVILYYFSAVAGLPKKNHAVVGVCLCRCSEKSITPSLCVVCGQSRIAKTPTTQRLVSVLNPAAGEAIAQGRAQHQQRRKKSWTVVLCITPLFSSANRQKLQQSPGDLMESSDKSWRLKFFNKKGFWCEPKPLVSLSFSSPALSGSDI